jgi:hypothetical protein
MREDGMASENYKSFAAASINSTEGAKDLTDKVGLLIIAEAWLELAEQTTQLMDREAEEAHKIIERPLAMATAQPYQQMAGS